MKRKYIWIIASTLVLITVTVLTLCFTFSCGTNTKTTASKSIVSVRPSWLELPSILSEDGAQQSTHYAVVGGKRHRNYTFLYDPQTYTSYWVAYPLCHMHMSKGRKESWDYDPNLPSSVQTSVARGYGVDVPTENYPGNFYSRGHQLPNADRNAVPAMMAQTYYSTNITPQIQNGFNAGVWKDLEEAVRAVVPHGDTLYVVTGASLRMVGENLAALKITNRNDRKLIPVPNYYWKALLKVRRENGQIVDATSIGFWLPHKDLKGADFTDYAVSVDQIEKWTGYDLFANLEDKLENTSETYTSWNNFISFR